MNRPSFLQIVSNKPPLFHYTYDHAIMDLLRSKSLLARPTWNFPDTDEYVLGLKLISDKLKRARVKPEELSQVKPDVERIFSEYCGGIDAVLDHVIAHIDYESNNIQKPKIEVYVACFSANGGSEKMVKAYGNVIIRFSPLLPFFAYLCPKPFLGSMLSRVTYDKDEFKHWIVDMGFNYSLGPIIHIIDSSLSPLSLEERIKALAACISESLCMFAPNIKKPKYSYEREWRLKSVISGHESESIFRMAVPRELQAFRLPTQAKFSAHTPRRYFHRLMCGGKFISEGITMRLNDGGRLAQEVKQWLSENSLGSMTAAQIVELARKVDA